MSSHAGISLWRGVSWQSGGMTPSFFCRAKRLFAQLVPALVELALVLVGPLLGHVVRRVGRAGREVDEERLVGCQRLLLRDPGHRLVGHVLHEVVALFGRLLRLDRRGAFVQRRVPLVRLAADEAVEVLEAAAARGPGVERSDRARLPHRHFVALAELRRGVAVELQRPRERRHGVGQHRAVARRAGGDLGDAAHAGGVVVAPGQQRLPRRRAEGGGVEAVVLQARPPPASPRSASGRDRRRRSTSRTRHRRSG